MKRIFTLCMLFAWFLNINAQNWVKQDSMANFLGEAAGFSIGNMGYIGTGFDGSNYSNIFLQFNSITNTWTQLANFPGNIRRDAVGFAINGKGYMGLGNDGGCSSIFRDWYEYDTAGGGSWTLKAPFPGKNTSSQATFVINNIGYVACGNDSTCFPTCYLWAYDPLLDTWTQKDSIPGNVIRRGATGFAIKNYGYVMGGYSGSSFLNDLWQYYPVLNSWTAKANFPVSTGWQTNAAFVIDTVAFELSDNNSFHAYQFRNDSWVNELTFTGPTRNSELAWTIGTNGYIIGGEYNYEKDCWQYTSILTGITNQCTTDNAPFIICPNPNNGKFTIQSQVIGTQNFVSTIEVYNVLGERVYLNHQITKLSNYQIDLSSQPNGVYFYRVIKEDGGLMGKGKLIIEQ